ncbi:MAG: MBOAT family O-acyltransferase [Gallionella sp.]
MNYTNSVFLLLFGITFVLYYLVGSLRWQLLILVIASLIFYAWESPPLLAIFLCSWFITGLSSYGVLTANSPVRAKIFATSGVTINLLLLGFFKYKFLVIQNVSQFSHQGPQTFGDWLILAPLPIGISFYTFHGISLLIDIYRGNTPIFTDRRPGLAKHLAETLLYLVFFPQLIAGPIIKAKDFYPQVARKRYQDIDFPSCFRILVVGYFLKSVIADNLSEQTYWIAYPYFQWKSSGDLLLLLYGYSAQIFADFAGYSLIAIGLAKLLGYKLPDNFNFPYLSSSISEFWRCWHISLSSWLREYLYIPLGGNKKGTWRTYINLIVVMFLGGLWHGAAWSFAIWGLWHGIGLVVERPWLDSSIFTSTNPIMKGIRIFAVFNFVTIGWLFFKLQNFSQAWAYLTTLFHSDAGGLFAISKMNGFILFYSIFIFFYHVLHLYKDMLPRLLKDFVYGAMLFLIVTNPGPSTPFIYFQF